jgi:hypothetical protein
VENVKELDYAQRTNDINALLQNILDATDDIYDTTATFLRMKPLQ